MPFLIDVYALAPERSVAIVDRFLDRFMLSRERADAEYWVTLDGVHPAAVFYTPMEMVLFCEAHPEAESRAYWNSLSAGDPHSAHAFFLPAGGLVLGLSVAAKDESVWDQWLGEMLSFVGAKYGYWTGECPPEDTVPDFVAMASTCKAVSASPGRRPVTCDSQHSLISLQAYRPSGFY